MELIYKSRTVICLVAVASVMFSQSLHAQDPAKIDSTHHKVIFENDQVRVFRVTYPPHEKIAMHSHPNSVVVCLTDIALRFTLPDGKTIEHTARAGQAGWFPATRHAVENVGDKGIEMIHIELKSPKKTK
jgi:quercetin dioxygenase-like cupin family protein